MWRLLGAANAPVLGAAEYALSGAKPQAKPVALPKAPAAREATPCPELDQILHKLESSQQAWAQCADRERAQLLRSCLKTTLDTYQEACKVSVDAKGSFGAGLGEEMLGWVPVLGGLRELAEALEAGGAPPPASLRVHPTTGQQIADVFPMGIESMLYAGFTGEMWLQPGQPASQGQLYQQRAAALTEGKPLASASPRGVSLVLGAGNQLPVVVLDILHKLVVEGKAVCVKMNPVNEYLGPFVRRALQPLADEGYFEVVYGGGEQGKYLCNHPAVADVHLTGSPSTYDAIVWGPGRAKKGDPPFGKPVTAELGCVTPYIIVPGNWTEDELQHVAELVVSGMLHNSGHNCLAAEIVVTDKGWPLRGKFLDAMRAAMDKVPQRACYYPGSKQKCEAFQRRFPDAENHGTPPPDGSGAEVPIMPLLFKTGLAPEEADTQTENWVPVLQEVALPISPSPAPTASTGAAGSTSSGSGGRGASGGATAGDGARKGWLGGLFGGAKVHAAAGGGAGASPDPAAFLKAATEFANNKCFGTLSSAMFIHPATQREARSAFDQAVAELRYGSIAVNCPGMVSFGITKLMWGAHPGHTPQDIGSGNCAVHNTLLFDHPQKSVLYGPWRYHPYPPWSAFHANLEVLAPRLANFFAAPSLLTLLPVVPAALRG